MKSTHNKIVLSTQTAALRFDEADGDDSRALDFEEFVAMQPTKVRESHSEATFRKWFDAADLDWDDDGNGARSPRSSASPGNWHLR